MRLYVISPNRQKVYLNLSASTRQELTQIINTPNFYLGGNLFGVQQVYAEKDTNRTAAGTLVGGLVGALGGPPGMIIGGILGGLLGSGSDEEETKKVEKFNNS